MDVVRLYGFPPGALVALHESGIMQSDLFKTLDIDLREYKSVCVLIRGSVYEGTWVGEVDFVLCVMNR